MQHVSKVYTWKQNLRRAYPTIATMLATGYATSVSFLLPGKSVLSCYSKRYLIANDSQYLDI